MLFPTGTGTATVKYSTPRDDSIGCDEQLLGSLLNAILGCIHGIVQYGVIVINQ